MAEISFDGVKKYMDTTLVLKNITFMVTEGEKVGIVGENGSGKSTILKLIAGILELNHCAGYPYAPVPPGYDEGWVRISKDTNCAYLEQIPQYSDNMKVIDVLNLSFDDVHRIEKEMHELELSMQELDGVELKKTLSRYSELVQLYEVKGGYDIEEKLNKICKGLQFEESFLQQDFNSLSGGEKTTVILGKLLIDAPDVLLLDEPTNHLDMDSVEWLEGYIKNYKGIVIVVSHDRYFLDHTVMKIIEVENKECETYMGNYSDFVRQKDENLRIQFNDYKDQKKQIEHMEQSIKELREWAKRANNEKFYRRAASMQIKLDKMERVEKPVIDKQNMKMNIQTSERSGKIVVKAFELCKNFENKTIFKNAGLLIQYGERVALIGPNGSGKTTFLKMLLGEISADSGETTLGASVMMAYLPQNIAFEDEELTVLDYFRDDISILEGKAREHLAKFMFYGGNVFKKIKLLSGGERVRLKLCKLLYNDVNLLILDEPTNHLDTASIESIEEALSYFKGTILFISHDRYFINKISGRVIAIEDHGFNSYLGNYDYYKEQKDKQDAKAAPDLSLSNVRSEQKQVKYKNVDNMKSNRKEKIEKNEKDTLKTEGRVKDIENELKEIDGCMQAACSDFEKLSKLFVRKEELSKELDAILEGWVNT
ncbi:MAG TPA: ABC-F type ribosomal protection protein [Mobilitalea sp.]|nr:ABC-F type ribosomal protection protein [Mobilitalea sp.]